MKKVVLKILGGIVILAIFANTNIVLAASTNELQSQKSNNNEKINDAQNNLQEVQVEKTETVKQVESLSSQISEYEKQINELDSQIDEKNNQISETEGKIQEKEKDFTEKEELLNDRLVATYEAGDTSYLDVLLSSKSVTDLISNYYLVTEVATYDTDLLNKIQQEKKEIEEEKQSLETAKNDLDSAKANKESVTVQLNSTKAQKSTYVAQLSEKERDIQAEIQELKEANVQIDKDISNARAQYAKQIEDLKKKEQNNNTGGSSTGGGTSSSGFIRPVNSYVTVGINYSDGSYHGGVDFGAAGVNGMPVLAVADGVVIKAVAQTTSYGNYVIIAHANGLYTLYAHGQSGSIRVSPGQTVSQGQQIMNVGSTGNSTGPHLHFEVRTSPGNYENRVNPLNYLP